MTWQFRATKPQLWNRPSSTCSHCSTKSRSNTCSLIILRQLTTQDQNHSSLKTEGRVQAMSFWCRIKPASAALLHPVDVPPPYYYPAAAAGALPLPPPAAFAPDPGFPVRGHAWKAPGVVLGPPPPTSSMLPAFAAARRSHCSHLTLQ